MRSDRFRIAASRTPRTPPAIMSPALSASSPADALEPVVHCSVQVVSASYPDDAADADALLAAVRSRLPTPSPPSEKAQPTGAGAPSLGDVSS